MGTDRSRRRAGGCKVQAAIKNTLPIHVETEAQADPRAAGAQRIRLGARCRAGAQAQAPENRDVLYMLAVAQRYVRRIPDALATLAELERHHPRYGRLFQERGHCHVAVRAAEPAIEAYLKAVALNTCLPASWSALEKLFRMTGRRQGCQTRG